MEMLRQFLCLFHLRLNGNMDKEPITISGLKQIKDELAERKNLIRPKIVNAISEARSHGDLKENAEYHAAKEEQGLNEKRIREIEGTIARAEIIDITKISSGNKIIFGSTIEVQDLESKKKNTYKRWAWVLTGSGHFFSESIGMINKLSDVDLFISKASFLSDR